MLTSKSATHFDLRIKDSQSIVNLLEFRLEIGVESRVDEHAVNRAGELQVGIEI